MHISYLPKYVYVYIMLLCYSGNLCLYKIDLYTYWYLRLLTYLHCLLRMIISLNNLHVFLSRIYNESVQSCGIFIRQYLADINEVGASGAQLPGRQFSPSDISKKPSNHFLLHFWIEMGSYDHHEKY